MTKEKNTDPAKNKTPVKWLIANYFTDSVIAAHG
jgi:hypothetical protein